MISVQNLNKQYANQIIFDNIGFRINVGERIGLVGRNGHGKTTLFNLITGREQCDSGTITIPKDYRIGYINQQLKFSKSTVLDECCSEMIADVELEDWKAKKVLSGLGFTDKDFGSDPLTLSGGYQIRLYLAKVLVAEPNLLLLDEPTNFLDIISIRWLTKFLAAWRGETMVISHDRGFIDNVSTHIAGVHRCKVRKIKGSTCNYYDQITKEEEVYERVRLNDDKKRKQTEIFITRFRAKARLANLVQSRVKSLEKQKKQNKLEEIKTLSFSFNAAPIQAKCIMEGRNLSFAYSPEQEELFGGLDFTVESNDRICIVGKNGKGKSTLLKLLAGKLKPLDGDVKWHPRAKVGYFEQGNTASLDDDKTIEDEMMYTEPDIERKAARDVCGKMMFSGDDALKKINVLSGGEKSRVLLGKLLLKQTNLLLLDEPTHHFDMESCESIIDAIYDFDGAAVIVSHDEFLLESVANKLIVFHNGKVFLFRGPYLQFLEEIGWGDEDNLVKADASKDQNKQPNCLSGASKKEIRKSRSEFFARRSKVLEPYKKEIERIESDIDKMERKLDSDTQLMIKASEEQNVESISMISKSMKELRTNIDVLYEELEMISEKFEQEKLIFDREEMEL